MANNFEYKIHVSIDQSTVKDDVKKALADMAKEVKNNAFQIELTGDPKNLIKQLMELQKQVPNLDLSKGLEFHLADAIKDDSVEGKKIIKELTTYIINSVNEAVSSIDSISESIKNTEKLLDELKQKKKNLLKNDGTADAVTAFEKAQERLEKASNKFSDSKQNKGKLAAAEEMKQAYQDMLNYQAEAGKEMSEKSKQILGVFAQDIDKTFKDINGKEHTLKDFLGDVKVNSSYKKDLQDIENQILSTENKLTSLKKELESATNPELKVKGKLADNFIEDLQSQLDSLQGLEVKVKPVVDKDEKAKGASEAITSSSTQQHTEELHQEEQAANEAATAEEKLSDVVAREEATTDIHERTEALEEESAAAEEATESENRLNKALQEHIYKKQSGNIDSGNFSYDRYTDSKTNIERYHGVVSTDKEGNTSEPIERLIVDYDKLLSELLKYDTQIYKIQEEINQAQGDTSGLQAKKKLAEDQLAIYEELMDKIANNPEYATNQDQRQLEFIEERRNLKDQELQLETQIAKAKENEAQKQLAINETIKVQESSYRKIQELTAKINLADDKKDSSKIDNWNKYLEAYQKVYDLSTDRLKELDEEKAKEQELIGLAKIRQQVNEKYNSDLATKQDAQRADTIAASIEKERAAYKKIWDIKTQIAKIDQIKDYDKNKDKIAALQNEEKKQQEIYDNEIKNLKAIDEQIVKEEELNYQLKIRLEAEAKINDIKAAQRDATRTNSEEKTYQQLKANIEKKAQLKAENIRYEMKGMTDTESYKNNEEIIASLNKEIDAVSRLMLTEEHLKSVEEAEAEAKRKVQKATDEKAAAEKRAAEAGKLQEQNLERTRSALQKQAAALTNNGKLMKEYGDQVYALLEEIKNPTTTIERLQQIRIELNKISADATVAGKSGRTFFQMLEQRAKSLIAYLSTFASFYRVIGYVRSAIQTLSDLDTQLIDLRKTTLMSTSELNKFYRVSTDIGKQLGVTTSEIISQAAAWSRLGYNTKEATEQMAALSSKFASISPGVEVDNATDYLVSTMQAFKIKPEEVERTIMDNINAIGNTMATTNGEIGEMLERSSAAMKAANNTLEETIALEAAAVEITRNAETTGTAFRTISMRIRGYDEETEELSEDLADISGEIADLTKTSKNAPISIFTDDTKQTYKSTYQILKEIADIWENLTDKQQAGLLEKLGGKRGAQSLAGILADFSSVEDALKTMEEAGGSAEREMSIIRESLDFKVNALKQTWVGILQDLVDRGVIGDFVDSLTKISEALGNILSQTGLLKTAFIGLSTIIGSRRLNLFDYTKGNGLTVGNVKVFDIFKNINGINGKEIMAQGENQHFVDLIEKSGINSPSMIDKLGNTYNAHPALVQACKDWENLGDEIKNTTTRSEYFISQNQTGFQKLGGALATFSGGLKNIAGNIAKMFLNGLASAGISILISKTIQGIYTLYDNWAHKAEKAKEAADEAKQTIKETNDALTNAQKTISSVKDKYAELAQEVRNLGTVEQNQGNLSNEEYQEFLDISNQLAELYPTLTSNYDENGNAILDLSGDVDTIVGSLNDLVDTQEKLANTEVLNSMDKIWTDYNNNLTSAKEKMDELKAEYNGTEYSYSRNFNQQYQDFLDVLNANGYVREQDTSDVGYTARAFERAGLNINEYLSYNSRTGEHGFDFSSLSEQQIEDIKNAFANMRSEYLAQVKGYEDSVTQANKEMGKYVSQSMKTVDYYDSLSEAEQKIMDNLLLNLDYSKLQEKHQGDWNGVFEEVQNQFRNSFSKISDEDREAIQNYYKELFEPNEDGTEKTIAQIRELAKNIVAILGGEFSEFDILEALGLGGRIDKAQKQKERLGYKTNVSGYNDAMRNKEVSDFVDNLNDKEIDILASLNIDDYKSIAEIKDAIAKMQEVADTDKVKVTTAVDAVDSIAAAKEAITSLDDLWQETVQNRIKLGKDKKYTDENGNVTKQLDEKGQAIGYADSALINSVESAFKGIAEEDSKVSLALSEFEKTLVEIPGDAEAAQKAIDNLITAYIDQTDIIQNLTEANKEWSIAQLKAYGVTNAEDVVISRLNTRVKQLAKQFAAASDSIKVLNTEMQGSDKWNIAIGNVQNDLNKTFTTKTIDSMGQEQEFNPNFNQDWIIKNLDLITEAANGSYEAIYALEKEAAKRIAMQVDINAPDATAVDATLSQINGLIDAFPIDTLEVGTSLDTNPMIQGLNALVDAGKITRDSMNAILASIGVSPTITWEDVPITVVGAADIVDAYTKAGNTTAGIQTQKGLARAQSSGATVGTVRMPRLGYAITSKGVGAQYASPSTGSSSGGSGGGGGGGSDNTKEPNKPKEEAEESFDWIEVAIKRIEEEIARLDKVVGNSYDLWTHRNSALLKELEKTKEEIKAQQIAQSEYLRNANAVKVNNGKGLNPDDYGENDELVKAADQKLLDAAKKAWATGEYQKKVREGLMTGDDIEKIQNHFLADAIKEYQEL